ncbi:MAG: aminoacyl-tRNA hydrolase [Saprospiraceae bacterium]
MNISEGDQLHMKYLIVGLGNPGHEYEQTRHNIGFLAVDLLAKKLETTWKQESLAEVAIGKHKGRSYYMLKPTLYMNLSGKSVRYWMQKLGIDASNIIVIVDDLALDLGQQRLRANGSAGGHNGLKDIEEKLEHNKYARLRLGIGNQFNKGKQINYVLGEWTADEKTLLPDILQKAADTALSFGSIGIERTMNFFNIKEAKKDL